MLLIVLLCCQLSCAQYNLYRLSVGIGGGVSKYFGDIEKGKITGTFTGSFDYNITPFISAGLEFQKGALTAGDSILDPHQRFFKNNFTSIILNGKIQLGQLVNFELYDRWYYARGLYLGSGVGMISSSQTEIKRTKINPNGRLYTFPGKDKSMELVIPASIGYNYEMFDKWGYTRYIFFINHQFNVTFGENIDGYNDPPGVFKNASPDMYGLTTIGIKYTFGPEGIY